MSNETLDFLRGWTEKHDSVLAAIGADITAIRDGLIRIEHRVNSVEESLRTMAGQTYANNADIAALFRRVERIETRLNIAE